MGAKEKEEYVGSLNYRYLIQGHYKIVYEIIDDVVVIQDVFDSRQNPQNMLRNR
jgi:toxin ParE1/3/4